MILRARTSSVEVERQRRATAHRRHDVIRPRVRANAAATAAARTSSCPPLSPPRFPLLFLVFRPPRRPTSATTRTIPRRRAGGGSGGTIRNPLTTPSPPTRVADRAGRSVTPHPLDRLLERGVDASRGCGRGRLERRDHVASGRGGDDAPSRRIEIRRTLGIRSRPRRRRSRRRPRLRLRAIVRVLVAGGADESPDECRRRRSTPPSLATERLIFSTFAIFADSVVVPDATTGGNEGATTSFAEDASNANLDPSTPIASKISSRTTRARGQGETGAVSASAIASPPRSARRRTSCSPRSPVRSVASTFSPAGLNDARGTTTPSTLATSRRLPRRERLWAGFRAGRRRRRPRVPR